MKSQETNRNEVFRIRKRLRFQSFKEMRKDSTFSTPTDFNHLLSFYFPHLDPVLNPQDHKAFALLSEALLSSFSNFFSSKQEANQSLNQFHYLLLLRWSSQNYPILLSPSDAPLAFILSNLASQFHKPIEHLSINSPTLQEVSLAIISNLIAVEPHSNSKFFDLIGLSSSFLSVLSQSFYNIPMSLTSEVSFCSTQLLQFLTNVVVSGAPLPASEINPFILSLSECSPLPIDSPLPLFLLSLVSSLSSLLNVKQHLSQVFSLVRVCSRFLLHQSESALQALSRLLNSEQIRFLIIEETKIATREGVDRLLRWARLSSSPHLQTQILQFIDSLLPSNSLLLPLVLESRELLALLSSVQQLPPYKLAHHDGLILSLLNLGKTYLSFIKSHNLPCFQHLGYLISSLINIAKLTSPQEHFIQFWGITLQLVREREYELPEDTDFFSLLEESLQDFLSSCDSPISTTLQEYLLSLGVDTSDLEFASFSENQIIL